MPIPLLPMENPKPYPPSGLPAAYGLPACRFTVADSVRAWLGVKVSDYADR